jgi:hypothetical protein
MLLVDAAFVLEEVGAESAVSVLETYVGRERDWVSALGELLVENEVTTWLIVPPGVRTPGSSRKRYETRK